MNHLRRHKSCGIQTAGFARSPPINFARLSIERVGIQRRFSRAKAECNVLSVLVPLDSPDYAQRNLWAGLLPSRSGILQPNYAGSIFVGDKRNRATVFADIEIVYIPLDVGSEILRLQRAQIEVRQALELRIAIGSGVEALA